MDIAFSTYMCLFNCQRKNKKIIYANVYRNTINDGDSQTSPLPIFPEGGGDVCTQARIKRLFEKNTVYDLEQSVEVKLENLSGLTSSTKPHLAVWIHPPYYPPA